MIDGSSVARVGHEDELVTALVDAVLDGSGTVAREDRRAVAEGGLPAGAGHDEPLARYLAKVRRQAYTVTDDDVAALLAAGHGEEQLFELTVAAAVGESLRVLERGRVLGEARHAPAGP